MVVDQTENFSSTNLSADVTSGTTTFPVVNVTKLPDPVNGNFNVIVWDSNTYVRPGNDPDVEIVRVTDRDTGADEVTVQRGQENTSAASHPSASTVHMSPTAKLFEDLNTEFGLFWDENKQELVAEITSPFIRHSTQINSTYDVGSNEGTVLAGPVSGTGQITGSGRVTVVEEGHQKSFTHEFDHQVDAQGNGIINVSEVSGSWRNTGTATQSGDGSTTTFSIAHGLSTTPSYVDVTAASEDASTDFWVSNTDGTNIDITYAAAPVNATDNLSWYWEAEV